MENRRRVLFWGGVLFFVLMLPLLSEAKPLQVNARSAILIDMSDGRVLFEQNADALIPPASITKVITLYLVFDAIKEGRAHLWDSVRVSHAAASTGGSRMGLRAGRDVQLQELIRGAAVVSGNDACVALAEHLSGNVESFVRRMNAKARELGMTRTVFMTPNGLPAAGQVTTARDIAKLSIAYLRRFPESLAIHSLQSYTYINNTHHNANRLLGKCPGVDGLKTGFVCASGYNITATAKRGDTRMLAVVLGAPTPGVRTSQTTKLIEAGFHKANTGSFDFRMVADTTPERSNRVSEPPTKVSKTKAVRSSKRGRALAAAKSGRNGEVCEGSGKSGKTIGVKKTRGGKQALAAKQDDSRRSRQIAGKAKGKEKVSTKQAATVKNSGTKKSQVAGKKVETGKTKVTQQSRTSSKVKQAKAAPAPQKKQPETKKTHRQAQESKKRQG